MPTAWPPSCAPSAPRRRCRPRPTWSMPATGCSGPKRWWPRPSAKATPAWSATRASWCRSSARRAGPSRPATPRRRPSRPSACARCCWPFRATCASCCCAWPRACRPCAGTPAARVACPQQVARESQQVFAPLANRLGIWQIKWELEDLAFRFLQAGGLPARGRLARRDAQCARGSRRPDFASRLVDRSARARHRGRGAGAAQAPVQHLEEDAGQASRLRPGARPARRARHRARRGGLLRRAGARA